MPATLAIPDLLDVEDLAHDARNALTSVLGRLQLLRRQAERGEVDLARVNAVLVDAEARLRRLAALVDALEDAGSTPLPGGVALARRAA
jgi:nitrogen-specific signal transduction histidine kinase